MGVMPGRALADPGRDEAKWFFVLLLTHGILWTVLPAALGLNLRVDVVEGLFWGHEWQLGYYKHPPLAAWLLEAAVTAFGRHDLVVYGAAQLSLCVSLTAVWALSRDLLSDARERLLAVFLLEWIPFHNIVSIEYNPNTVMLPCWALTTLFFWWGLRRGRLVYWLLAGACGALSLYGKYESMVLLLSLLLVSFLNREFRKKWRTPHPYAAVAVCALGFAPHLAWMLRSDFVPVTYAIGRASGPVTHHGFLAHVVNPLRFAGEQFLVTLPFIAFYSLCRKRLGGERAGATPGEPPSADGRSFLAAVCFGPFLLFALLSVVTGWRILFLWGVPLYLFLPLYCLTRWPVRPVARGFAWATGAVVLVYAAGYAVATPYIERLGYPGRELAAEVLARWQERFPGVPIRYVVGAERYQGWLPGNTAYYLPQKERPSVWLEFNPTYTPWMNLADLRREGGVVLWSSGDAPPPWTSRFTYREGDVQCEIRLKERRQGKMKDLTVHVILVAPAPGVAKQNRGWPVDHGEAASPSP